MSISNDGSLSAAGLIGDASNIKIGSNPPFLLADFLATYPQYGPDANTISIVSPVIVQMYIDLANACIKEARWHSYWKVAMGWFVAHFCALYLQGAADPNSGAAAVKAAGEAKGLLTSETAGPVSASIDFNTIGQDLDGWAAWKLTIYGQQLATVGKLLGKGGMYVY